MNIYPFSDWLRNALREAHMTQMELALELDMGQGRISRYINGIETPKLENIVRILEVFGKKIVVEDQE